MALSSAFRRFGVQAVAPHLKGAHLSVDAHPLDTFTVSFDDLQTLRHGPGQAALMLECVHESAVVGSVPLTEGVEEEAEAAVCRETGFQLIQGYLTGRPMAGSEL